MRFRFWSRNLIVSILWGVATHTCPAQKADNSTISGKVLVGYQGFYRCPGDGSPNGKWSHWSNGDNPPASGSWDVEMLPDTKDLDSKSLCSVPNIKVNGIPVKVFTSFAQATTDTHFKWMRDYQIDGALLQRFVTKIPQYKTERDGVLQHAVISANTYGRVLAVEYDLTGVDQQVVFTQVTNDWLYLTRTLEITKNPCYLKEGRRPIVSLWGLGFKGSNYISDPVMALRLIRWFQTEGHATVMGGVPSGWNTLSRDSNQDQRWRSVYLALDIVQPWTVGRYKTTEDVNAWSASHLRPDLESVAQAHQLYLPVIFPGFSWHNRHNNAVENEIPRDNGKFFMLQAQKAKQDGARSVKIAMFDELNEGTAIMKVIPSKTDVPDGYWLTLDADGEKLESDQYLRLSSQVAALFH